MQNNQWQVFADEVLSLTKSVLDNLEIDREDGLQVLSSILFRRVIFGAKAVYLLVRNKLYTEARIQRRGQLEALFSLGALYRSPDILQDFVNKDVHRRIKFYQNIKKTSKKFRGYHLGDMPDSEIDKEIEELNSKKGPHLSLETLSQKAGLHDLFLSDYSMLSEAAHHAAKDLERHVEVDKEGNITGFLLEDPETDMSNLLYPALSHLLMAWDAINDIYRLGQDLRIKETSDKLEELA
ncbi:DUF5677 domain-containing protein [Amphritea pacifica]|uniref:DUF5677 domain-containing protein n=1 Tax=Amphritea pacifica TaxID=2811233 RepID=UPI001965B556|nr:DUF5677 domain-containing protein [Amphritea pacifica]MBN1008195.1 hypothetical protein [Amphritea pacifica]